MWTKQHSWCINSTIHSIHKSSQVQNITIGQSVVVGIFTSVWLQQTLTNKTIFVHDFHIYMKLSLDLTLDIIRKVQQTLIAPFPPSSLLLSQSQSWSLSWYVCRGLFTFTVSTYVPIQVNNSLRIHLQQFAYNRIECGNRRFGHYTSNKLHLLTHQQLSYTLVKQTITLTAAS